MGQFWGQVVPAWIEAIATAGALIAASVAAYFAWRSLRAETARVERSEAWGLSAWWLTGQLDGEEIWAVAVSNSSAGVFRDVVITTTGNSHPRAAEGIDIRMLPPGQWVVQSLPRGARTAWGAKRRVSPAELERLDPLLDARRWDVTSIRFHDIGMRSWEWSASHGLTRASSS